MEDYLADAYELVHHEAGRALERDARQDSGKMLKPPVPPEYTNPPRRMVEDNPMRRNYIRRPLRERLAALWRRRRRD